MDHIFRMLTAIFYLVLAAMLFLLTYMFAETAFAVIFIYSSFILILMGIGKGFFAIVDYNRAKKNEENE